MTTRPDELNSIPLAHPRVQQLDALTSLRFFAALYVLAFHYNTLIFGEMSSSGFVSLGYSGVTFFFLLSGFILSHTYQSVDFTKRQFVNEYLLARIARIYPVFIVSLLVSVPFFIKTLLNNSGTPQELFAASIIILTPLGLHAWVPGIACALNCPSWSISTELFFYCMFPLVLARVSRRPFAWCAVTTVCLLVSWSVFGLIWSMYGHGYSLTGSEAHRDDATNLISQFVMYFPLGRLPEFIFGILLFVYWSANKKRISAFWLVVASIVFGLTVLVSQAIIPDVLLHNGLTAIVWAPLILAGASMRAGLLSWPPLVFLGRISFSLYLLHMTAAHGVLAVNKHVLDGALSSFPWSVALGTTLLAISISALTYKLIEEPGRRYIVQRWKRYHARRVAVLSTPVSALQQSALNATPRPSDNPV